MRSDLVYLCGIQSSIDGWLFSLQLQLQWVWHGHEAVVNQSIVCWGGSEIVDDVVLDRHWNIRAGKLWNGYGVQ